jgi:hypothetical protein
MDIFYSSVFKKDYETFYDFTIPLDINLDIKEDEKLTLQLVDFAMMNSMLTISTAHKNNKFSVVYETNDIEITIPDGSYTATSLRDWINSKLNELEIPLVFNYDKITNKYNLTVGEIYEGDFIFYTHNCTSLFGFIKPYYFFNGNTTYYAETFVNMLPYTKIIIATNLVFTNSSQNNFQSRYNSNSGIGDIIAWVSRDVPLFSTITYINNQNREIEIANKNIKSLQILIMNEFKEFITDCPECHIHLRLMKKKNLIEY